MAKETIYTCDRCSKTEDAVGRMCEIKADKIGMTAVIERADHSDVIDICVQCLGEFYKFMEAKP